MKFFVKFSFHSVNLYINCEGERPRTSVLGLILHSWAHTSPDTHEQSCCRSKAHGHRHPPLVHRTGWGQIRPSSSCDPALHYYGGDCTFLELRGRDKKKKKGSRADFFRFSCVWRTWGEFSQEVQKNTRHDQDSPFMDCKMSGRYRQTLL